MDENDLDFLEEEKNEEVIDQEIDKNVEEEDFSFLDVDDEEEENEEDQDDEDNEEVVEETNEQKLLNKIKELEDRLNSKEQVKEEVKQEVKEEVVNEEYPLLSDYDYDEEKHQEAVYKYYRNKEIKEEKSKLQEIENNKLLKANEERVNSIIDAHKERVRISTETKYKDFGEYLDKAKGSKLIANETAEYLMEDDNSADIHYYLVRNLKKWNEIAEMPIAQQIREVSKISKKISEKKKQIEERRNDISFSPIERTIPKRGEGSQSENSGSGSGDSYFGSSMMGKYRNSRNRLN